MLSVGGNKPKTTLISRAQWKSLHFTSRLQNAWLLETVYVFFLMWHKQSLTLSFMPHLDSFYCEVDPEAVWWHLSRPFSCFSDSSQPGSTGWEIHRRLGVIQPKCFLLKILSHLVQWLFRRSNFLWEEVEVGGKKKKRASQWPLRGVEWGGSWEGGSREGTCEYLRLILLVVWQEPAQHGKAIILQLNFFKRRS